VRRCPFKLNNARLARSRFLSTFETCDLPGLKFQQLSIVRSSAHGCSPKWAVDEKMGRAIFCDGHVIWDIGSHVIWNEVQCFFF
jgi:hypothetical protein